MLRFCRATTLYARLRLEIIRFHYESIARGSRSIRAARLLYAASGTYSYSFPSLCAMPLQTLIPSYHTVQAQVRPTAPAQTADPTLFSAQA